MADDVAQAHLDGLILGQPEELQERAVDVMAAFVAVDVRDRCRHAVHDRAQLAFACGQRVLCLFQVRDVVADDVEALHRAVELGVRDDAAAQPARAARRIDDGLLVGHGLAGGRPQDEGLQRRVVSGARDFGRRAPDDILAFEAGQEQKRFVDEQVPEVLVQVDDGLRNVVREEAQLLLAGGQRLLGQLQIVDVVFGAIQAADGARHIEVGHDAAVHPAVPALRRCSVALVFDVLARLRALQDRSDERGDVGGHHLERRLAIDFILWLAYRVGECLVHERVFEATIEVRDRPRNVVRKQAHLRFLRLQRVADPDVVLDIVHHRKGATYAAADFAIGEQRDTHPSPIAGQLALAPLVGHRRAGERPLDVPLHFGQRVDGQDFLQRMTKEVVRRHADPCAEGLVGEAQLQLAVEVQDRQADTVCDEPQTVFALTRLELESLQVVDVAVRDEEAAHLTLGIPVRVVVDADPHRWPPRRDELPLVHGPLAGQGGVDVRVVELVDVAAEDLDHLAAEDLVRALSQPLEHGLVGEAIALVAVDIGQRDAQRIELVLGKRCQRLPLRRQGEGLRQGQFESVQRSR